ncbi:MAG: helix-turn-helix domain-containing protein [Endomicrobiia bacterium]|nr:helix-turn-helix domain-containing protein [Endomicrobiaceae bacterium]
MKIEKVLSVFNVLSQESRLKIFRILVEHSTGGITPTEISKILNDMPRNTLSFHLSLIAQADLCKTVKQGKQVIYKANCNTIKGVAQFLLKDCCEGACKC